MDEARPSAEAVAVRGGVIVVVGSNAEVTAAVGEGTRRIDLQGRTVIPGFNDAHVHLTFDPPGEHVEFATRDPQWHDARGEIGRRVATSPAGTWIFVTAGPTVILDATITRTSLDRIAPAHPLLIRSRDGHGSILNTAALRALAIRDEEPDPFGGWFGREAGTRRLDGRAWEYAAWNIDRLLGQRSADDDVIAAVRALAHEAAGYGITSLQVTSSSLRIERLVELLVKAALPIRVRAIPFPLTEIGRRHRSETRQAPFLVYPTSKVTVGGITWVLDGTPVERGAALRTGYADAPGESGRLNFPDGELDLIIDEAIKTDQPLLLHASGDRAVAVAFDALERTARDGRRLTRRVRIDHGDGLIGDLASRARALGIVVVQHPARFDDADLLRQRWGGGMQPMRSLVEAGIPVALASDGRLNPFASMLLATTHPAHPSEALTIEQALRAYTRDAAFAEHQENWKGTIAPGRAADLVVLSHDIRTLPPIDLPNVRALMTIVGGEIVHESGAAQ